MATTLREQIGKSTALLADVRNAGTPYFEKDVFIYCHRYVVTTDYTATDVLTIQFDGALEILFCQCKEILTATDTNLNATRADISGRVGKQIVTAATNGSSLAVEIFAIVRV